MARHRRRVCLGLVGALLMALAAAAACSPFNATDDGTGTDGGSEAAILEGAPPSEGAAVKDGDVPGLDDCIGWATRHGATLTRSPNSHNGSGSCRFCKTTNALAAVEKEIRPASKGTHSIEAWSQAADSNGTDGLKAVVDLGFQFYELDGAVIPAETRFSDTALTTAWAKSQTSVPTDRAVSGIASIAILDASVGQCIEFDDVVITPPP